MQRKLVFLGLSLITITLIVLSLTQASLAFHKKQVLGEQAVVEATPQIAPTSEGPGLILPDSPLFFLDHFKQNVRLLFALSPEAKARIHANVAGERMAEVRLMLAKERREAAKIALEGVSENFQRAAEHISEAKLTGRDVSFLAKAINDDIKAKRKLLLKLKDETTGEIKIRAKIVNGALLEAKVEIEDSLPEEEIEKEIEDDLEDEIEDSVEEASESAKGIEHAIDVLTQLASRAAEKQQRRRAEALRHAIEVKNEALRRQEERLLEKEKKKHEKLFELREKSGEEARKAAKRVQEAAEKFQKIQEKIRKLRIQPIDNIESNEEKEEKQKIDLWIVKNNLNQYGDPKDTVYTGGTPLFNETTGKRIDRYEYIINKYPNKPWINNYFNNEEQEIDAKIEDTTRSTTSGESSKE